VDEGWLSIDHFMSTSASSPPAAAWWQVPVGLNGGVSVHAIVLFLVAFAIMYAPAYMELAETTWTTDEQGHGPLILAAAAWLLWSNRQHIFEGPPQPAVFGGFAFLIAGVVIFSVARSQQMIEVEVASQMLVLIAGFLLLHGKQALRRAWFPLFFLLFMVPLPSAVVQALTLPLKSAVSVVAENVLYWAGYPIGRTGVMLTVGPYQLLVADACSGLNSLFTLEALGLLYMNIMNYQSKARNIILAIAIIPISFVANVTRVIVLVLVTYHLGDEAGQGFMHGFAGLVLFAVALTLTYGFDRLLAVKFDDQGGARGVSK
jgi:exosortase B